MVLDYEAKHYKILVALEFYLFVKIASNYSTHRNQIFFYNMRNISLERTYYI
jgi:hypothetical protein